MENQEVPGAERGGCSADLGLFPIRVVAKQTGVGIHTLRAWERRYGLPCPARTTGTHRLYGAQDIAHIQRVQQLLRGGTPPSRACALVLAESREPPLERDADDRRPAFTSGALIEAFTAACVNLDEVSAQRLFSESLFQFGPELSFATVILPALSALGSAWAEGRASIAAEHFGSGLIRARLFAAFEGGALGNAQPVALLGACPGDQHEIPTLVLALLLRRRGWRPIWLGSDTPYEALIDAIQRTRPQLICLSSATDERIPALVDLLQRLRRLPECGPAPLTYGGAPFTRNPRLREPLEATAIYLGDDLGMAADRAGVLCDCFSGARGSLMSR